MNSLQIARPPGALWRKMLLSRPTTSCPFESNGLFLVTTVVVSTTRTTPSRVRCFSAARTIAPIPPSARRAAEQVGMTAGGGGDSSSGGAGAPQPPKFKIQVHILAYSLLLLPVCVYAVYADRHALPKEQLEEELRSRYGTTIAEQQRNNVAMGEFFRNTILNPEAGVEDERLKEVLHGGSGRNQKRFYEVDASLQGTAEGEKMAKQTQEELRIEAEARKARRQERRRKKKEEKAMQQDAANQQQQQQEQQQQQSQRESVLLAKIKAVGETVDAKQVAAIAVVGSVAAAVGFFLGGGRRN